MDWSTFSHSGPSPRRTAPPNPPRLATLFRVIGPSQRPIRCAIYRTGAGDELRVEYEDREDDFLITELFPSEDADGIATRAAEWRGKFDGKGFSELAIV